MYTLYYTYCTHNIYIRALTIYTTYIQSIYRGMGRVHARVLEAQGVLHSHGERHDELRGAGEVSG